MSPKCRCRTQNNSAETRPAPGSRDAPDRRIGVSGTATSTVRDGVCARQRRWNVDDRFAGGDELLCEKEPEPLGALGCPRRDENGAAHVNKLVDLRATGTKFQSSQFVPIAAHRDSGVGRLVRVDPDDHLHHFLHGLSMGGDRGAHSYFGSCSRWITSLEPQHGEALTGCSSFSSQTRHCGPAGASRATRPGPHRRYARSVASPISLK
jgi:hypothetical protein